MDEEVRQAQKRFAELAQRAANRSCYTETEFLTLAEQDVLLSMAAHLAAPVRFFGGVEGAERRVACFGSEAALGYPPESPVLCVCIRPASEKFAEALTHRDFLGSLMALGIRRGLLGDLAVADKRCYVFCLEGVADLICNELTQVRRTTVRCARCDPPETLGQPPEQSAVVVASQRLDAVIAGVWRLSRSESQALFAKKLVFVDSRLTENTSLTLKEGSVVSVRGTGRFLYEGVEKETKKGRLRVLVRVY